jgi:hypothetical protein
MTLQSETMPLIEHRGNMGICQRTQSRGEGAG